MRCQPWLTVLQVGVWVGVQASAGRPLHHPQEPEVPVEAVLQGQALPQEGVNDVLLLV